MKTLRPIVGAVPDVLAVALAAGASVAVPKLDPGVAKALAGIRGSRPYAYVERDGLARIRRPLHRPRRLHRGRPAGPPGCSKNGASSPSIQERYLLPYPSPYTVIRAAEMIGRPGRKTETKPSRTSRAFPSLHRR